MEMQTGFWLKESSLSFPAVCTCQFCFNTEVVFRSKSINFRQLLPDYHHWPPFPESISFRNVVTILQSQNLSLPYCNVHRSS